MLNPRCYYFGLQVDPIEALSEAIPGSPGEDYPIYASPPETSFGCDGYIEVEIHISPGEN